MKYQFRFLFTLLITFFSYGLYAQTLLPSNLIVSQNFNTIGSSASTTLPLNWRLSPAGNSVGSWAAGISTTTQAATSGTPATGGRYNWSTTAGTDRSLGFLTDATYTSPNAIMAYFKNTTGGTVNTIAIAFSIERYVVNTGSFSLSFASSSDGNTWTAQTGGDIATGIFASGTNSGTFATPQTINKTVTITIPGGLANNGDIYFRWTFNTSNTGSQGLGLDNVSLFAGAATPVLTATLDDLLQVDGGTIGQFNEGDVIRYHTVIKNIGTGDANNVQISIPPPSNTTLVSGSIKTSAVAVDDNYSASFNTMFSGSTVLANDFGTPLPTAVMTYGSTADATTSAPGVARTTDAGGTITLLADGTFTYTPPTGFSGVDRFKYITGNGNLPNNDAIVSIVVAGDIMITTTDVQPLCNGGASGSITVNASGGNGTLTYSKNGAAGPYQASNVFTGLAAGTYTIAVKDAGGYIKTTTVTLTDPAILEVSGTVSNLIYTTAMSSVTFSKTGGTGAVTWSAAGLPPGLTLNTTSGTLSGTPTQTGVFSVVITATDANGCIDTHPITINVAPKLVADSYTGIVGNTQLVSDAHSVPTTPYTSIATNILGNDVSDAPITVTAVTAVATTNGGAITIATNGKFTYSPPVGAVTTDSYTYTATSNSVSTTATINFTIADKVWYVNNTYSGGNGVADGRSHRPFTTLDAAASASAASQYIYVHAGSGTTTGNAILKANQVLRGAGSALTVGALSIGSVARPILSGMITLASNVIVDGFDMSTGSVTAITNGGTTVSGVNLNIGSIITSTGTGISITGTGNSVSMTIASLTTNGATNGVTLNNTAGSVIINGGSIIGGAGTAFNVVGGSATVNYAGSITQNTASQYAVNIDGLSANTISFTGNISAATTTAAARGININNVGGNVSFTNITIGSSGNRMSGSTAINITKGTGTGSGTFNLGSINLYTTGQSGLIVTDIDGTINVTTGTIDVAAGRAISIDGPSGLTTLGIVLVKVSSTNSTTNGIYIQDTNGSFTINGDGTNTTQGGNTTGGSISNSSGTDATTNGVGIYLKNTQNITLKRLRVNDHSNYAIYGDGVMNFILDYSTIDGANGTSVGDDESCITIIQLTGTATFFKSNISGGVEDNVRILNTSGTLSPLTFENMIMGHGHSTSGNTGLLVRVSDLAITDVKLLNNTFQGNRSNMFQLNLVNNGDADLIMTGNTFHNTHPNLISGGGGVTISSGGTNPVAANLTYNISNNSFKGSRSTMLLISKIGSNVTYTGTVSNNTFGQSGIGAGSNNSTSLEGSALNFVHYGGGNNYATVTNNMIYGYNNYGILAEIGDHVGGGGHGNLNLSITGNTIAEYGSLAFSKNGFHLNAGLITDDAHFVCLNLTGNSLTGSGSSGIDIRLRQRMKTTVRLPGYSGTNSDNAAVNLFVKNNNSGTPSVTASNSVGVAAPNGPGNGFVGGATCPSN